MTPGLKAGQERPQTCQDQSDQHASEQEDGGPGDCPPARNIDADEQEVVLQNVNGHQPQPADERGLCGHPLQHVRSFPPDRALPRPVVHLGHSQFQRLGKPLSTLVTAQNGLSGQITGQSGAGRHGVDVSTAAQPARCGRSCGGQGSQVDNAGARSAVGLFRLCGPRGRRAPGPQVKGSKRITSQVPDPPQPEPADSGAGPVTVRSFNRL